MKNRLKLLRVERGWTQEQMGQALGVSRQAVIALETERHDPSLDLAYRIAAVCSNGRSKRFSRTRTRADRKVRITLQWRL